MAAFVAGHRFFRPAAGSGEGGWAKWLTLSTIVIGSISYMGYLVTPDWREIVDSKHYYSNWKALSTIGDLQKWPNRRVENDTDRFDDYAIRRSFVRR
ncbi:hypothetical protein TELCIR_09083 [Teladorsagia circumcincta]|uniref:Uncharacterized protein n=1 Tax=Teladorsagia circumcincta TaxID=45464 RepID=A0A2G9UFT8_TELCI|nr:hypothetical protein TELCIR_09083 [Teladorsagia circumcincta]